MSKKNLLKNLLCFSLILSGINSYTNINTNFEDVATGITFIALAGGTTIGLLHLKSYFEYQNGIEIYNVLKEFHENPNMSYEFLKRKARNIYYDQNWFPSSTSLYSDYPIIWLEKRATEIKNRLGCCLIFNNTWKELSKNLGYKLNFLRNCVEFIKERKEYNDKLREENYRDSRISIEREKLNLRKAGL